MRCAVLTGICLAVAGAARAAEPVPATWAAYGQRVSAQLQAELGDDRDPAAARLHTFLDGQASHADRPSAPTVQVKLWFGVSGAVERAEFDTLGDAQADQDLRQVLRSHPVGAPPPPGMLQPMNLQVRLTTAPAPPVQ